MRSNALRKHEYLQDNVQETHESWSVFCARIAVQSHQACAMPENTCGPDLGEFEEKYLLGASDFA